MENTNENTNEKLKNFWNNCDTAFAHTVINKHLKCENELYKFWESSFINRIIFKNKIVLDYGIGGGYLGKYLFSKKDIKHYIGIDISIRSLKKTDLILEKYSKKYDLLNCETFYKNFYKNIDIIVCQACIQHFPNENYLINFLKKINQLNANTIMLQIAYNKNNKFHDKDYNTRHNVVRACYTNNNFILKYLTNYDIDYSSEIAKNNYQFLIFIKKK